MTTMNRRPGITLVEVLVAIFIMALGMIALLTLFPLGALNIAQALRDDRAAQAATNASAIANAQGLRHLFGGVFENQIKGAGFWVNQAHDPEGPSSPLYVDPYYSNLTNNIGKVNGGAQPTLGIRRLAPGYATLNGTLLPDPFFSLLDDLNFEPNGVPTISGGSISRTGRYTWAYLLRRPRLGDDRVADMSVVVYAGRTTGSVHGENTYLATYAGTLGTANSLTLNYGTAATKPRIRNGSWILDVTQDTCTNASTGRQYKLVRGHFYRVVDATENAANTAYTLELQTPLRVPLYGGVPPAGNRLNIVVMESVIEVFDRGTGYIP
jgi:type II secretory pathway pseudopilin PulG